MSDVEYMVKEKMERLTTKRLQAYKKKLTKCSDVEKKKSYWAQAYNDVTEVLSTRESSK